MRVDWQTISPAEARGTERLEGRHRCIAVPDDGAGEGAGQPVEARLGSLGDRVEGLLVPPLCPAHEFRVHTRHSIIVADARRRAPGGAPQEGCRGLGAGILHLHADEPRVGYPASLVATGERPTDGARPRCFLRGGVGGQREARAAECWRACRGPHRRARWRRSRCDRSRCHRHDFLLWSMPTSPTSSEAAWTRPMRKAIVG
jgi:hypothetical protein